jgi:3-oxoacyl-[acyl-carrier protein] reductase
MNLGLKNKHVLITGASRGVGSSIAESFLKEGARVLLVSRGSSQLYETAEMLQNRYGESHVESDTCDCTNQDSLLLLRDRVKKRWGRLDIVVANVGDGRSIPDTIPSDKQWKQTWDNNFESALYTSRTFLPLLQESKGTLLFISSIAAIEAFGAPVDYSTAKSAIIALSKNISRKIASEVRVNVIAPGNVIFPGSSWDVKIKENPARVDEIIKSTVPMKRFGAPEEIADAAVFLCSERAKFITGSLLVVDGGQTVGVY